MAPLRKVIRSYLGCWGINRRATHHGNSTARSMTAIDQSCSPPDFQRLARPLTACVCGRSGHVDAVEGKAHVLGGLETLGSLFFKAAMHDASRAGEYLLFWYRSNLRRFHLSELRSSSRPTSSVGRRAARQHLVQHRTEAKCRHDDRSFTLTCSGDHVADGPETCPAEVCAHGSRSVASPG